MDERLREREKGPDGNNQGMFEKRWIDHNFHEDSGESISMVEKRNIEVLNIILEIRIILFKNCLIKQPNTIFTKTMKTTIYL